VTAVRAAPIAGLHFLRGGDVSASVSARAAALRSLIVEGVDLVEPTMSFAEPPGMAGAVLAPWPNRVEAARWLHRGQELHLEVTEPELGHANHGLLAGTDFDIIDQQPDQVGLRARIVEPPGYPFRLEVGVRYRLRPDGVAVTISVRNTGATTAPFAVGAHPYLRNGPVADELGLALDAELAFVLDDTHIPRSRFAVDGTAWDLRSGRPVPDAPTHAAFERTGSRAELVHALTAADGRRVELRADPDFRFTQLYVAPALATDDGPRRAVAVEPMTAPPNALRTGEGVRDLPPGATWSAGYDIRLRQPSSRAR
jgi:aldose 1-epimerase